MTEQINVPGLLEAQEQQQPAPATGRTAVTVHDGLVVQHFEKAIEYAVYAPAGAISDGAKMLLAACEADAAMSQLVIDVAMAIIDGVYQMRGDLKPAGSAAKLELIERHRAKLRDRLRVVLNSQREKKVINNASLARQLVDICLSEVFS